MLVKITQLPQPLRQNLVNYIECFIMACSVNFRNVLEARVQTHIKVWASVADFLSRQNLAN